MIYFWLYQNYLFVLIAGPVRLLWFVLQYRLSSFVVNQIFGTYNLERIIIVFLIDIAFIIIVFIIINIIIIISSYQFIVTDFSIPPLGPVPCDCSISCPLHHLERTDYKHSLGIWD